MTAEVALNKQIERYRQMTGEQRLTIALELHEMACDIARAGIRRQRSGPGILPVCFCLPRPS